MKILFTTAFILLTLFVHAQTPKKAKIKELVEAEWAFINHAKEKNTRDAFIAYLADDAVTFGQDIQKGKAYLTAQQPNDSWLYWEPVFSVIAASGDFGFNTGPWQFRQKRTDEKAVAFGQFVSVWRKIGGEWKVVIDIGVSHGTPLTTEVWKTSSLESRASKSGETNDKFLALENQFQAGLLNRGVDVYKEFLSPEARLYRQKQEPITTSAGIGDYFNSSDEKVSFTVLGGDIASTGDLGYVYGKALVNGKADRNSFFIRIWRKEDKAWKIVVELIN